MPARLSAALALGSMTCVPVTAKLDDANDGRASGAFNASTVRRLFTAWLSSRPPAQHRITGPTTVGTTTRRTTANRLGGHPDGDCLPRRLPGTT